jgi:hypothetical protein
MHARPTHARTTVHLLHMHGASSRGAASRLIELRAFPFARCAAHAIGISMWGNERTRSGISTWCDPLRALRIPMSDLQRAHAISDLDVDGVPLSESQANV